MKFKDYEYMVEYKIYSLNLLLVTNIGNTIYAMNRLAGIGGMWSPIMVGEITEDMWDMELVDTERWIQ